jgi:hypothetical protein
MEEIDIYKDKVNCNLCGKLMTVYEWERHYDKCLLLEYLVTMGKQSGENYTREDLEVYEYSSLIKLYYKYNPEEREKDLRELGN